MFGSRKEVASVSGPRETKRIWAEVERRELSGVLKTHRSSQVNRDWYRFLGVVVPKSDKVLITSPIQGISSMTVKKPQALPEGGHPSRNFCIKIQILPCLRRKEAGHRERQVSGLQGTPPVLSSEKGRSSCLYTGRTRQGRLLPSPAEKDRLNVSA